MTEPASGWDCHVHVFDAAAPVRTGHYRPQDRPLSQIEAVAAMAGVGHLVLVQPSVYGTDNTLMLQALAQGAGRHRGVVVLDDAGDRAALDALHAVGVRGVRLNRVSPVGAGDDVATHYARLAPHLHERGWHLEWYAAAEQLPQIAALHADDGPVCVLDHLAGLRAGVEHAPAVWAALRALADRGAWVKLSGWYRLGASEPYAALWPTIGRVAAIFGERMVWGSDWPHTQFAAPPWPDYASTWTPVVHAIGAAAATAIRCRQPTLYR